MLSHIRNPKHAYELVEFRNLMLTSFQVSKIMLGVCLFVCCSRWYRNW